MSFERWKLYGVNQSSTRRSALMRSVLLPAFWPPVCRLTEPFAELKKMFPASSAAGPWPDIQRPPTWPFGVEMNDARCASVAASYAKIQPWYGPVSQYDENAMYTLPFASSSDERWLATTELNSIIPPVLPGPLP